MGEMMKNQGLFFKLVHMVWLKRQDMLKYITQKDNVKGHKEEIAKFKLEL